MQKRLVAHMERTEDPMLAAFHNRHDRAKVDEILVATYGPPKPKKEKKEKGKRKKSGKSAAIRGGITLPEPFSRFRKRSPGGEISRITAAAAWYP